MKQKAQATGQLTIINDKGLHTRPSTELVRCTAKYKSKITLTYQKTTVDGKSLLGILALAASKGAKIKITADGQDAEEAITALTQLAKAQFHTEF